jgi:hypothetical protein
MNGKTKERSEIVEKVTNFYTESPGLRYTVKQIPIIGPIIDDLFAGTGSEIRQRRFMEFLEILGQLTDKLDEIKIDYPFLESEEFRDLVVNTVQNSVRTSHKERVLLNCKILVGSILIDNSDVRHTAEDFLFLVSELSPIDLKVASEIYQQQKNKPDKFDIEEDEQHNELAFVNKSGWDSLQKQCNLNKTDFLLSLHKLSNANLIKQIVGVYSSYLGGKFIITPTFQRLMSLISYANEPIFINKLNS